jgi:hypothetical protein
MRDRQKNAQDSARQVQDVLDQIKNGNMIKAAKESEKQAAKEAKEEQKRQEEINKVMGMSDAKKEKVASKHYLGETEKVIQNIGDTQDQLTKLE